jgi:hypothetical protein
VEVAKARPTPVVKAPKKPMDPQASSGMLTRVTPPRESMMLSTIDATVPGSNGSASSRRPIRIRRASPSPRRKLNTITPRTTTWNTDRMAK